MSSSSSRHREKRSGPAEPRDRSRSRSPQPQIRDRKDEPAVPKPSVRTTPPKPQSTHKIAPLKSTGIKMKLGAPSVSQNGLKKPDLPTKKLPTSVFGDDDSEEEEEEIPAFAAMRMKNIGRKTPTSSGPNSFGKTKHGFCDQKKIFEKRAKDAVDD